jgi:hypothetical protein
MLSLPRFSADVALSECFLVAVIVKEIKYSQTSAIADFKGNVVKISGGVGGGGGGRVVHSCLGMFQSLAIL